MDEIKFRAKRTDNGKWVYGDLCHIRENNVIVPIIHNIDDNVFLKNIFVSTIGQYTGLKDKNGIEIYEGDILRYTRYNLHTEYLHEEKIENICHVYYNEEKHAFYYTMKLDCGGASGLLMFNDDRCDKCEIEVIGNKHDNPELMRIFK